MTSLPVYLATLFSPGNYTVSALSTIGSFSVVGGMIGSPTAGTILDKTGGYRWAARIQTIMCAIVQAMAIYVIPAGNLTLACIWCFVIGFWFSWTFPCYINYSILITHPIPSDTTNGIMIALSFVYSSIAGIFMTKLFEIKWGLGMGILISSFGVCFILSLFMKVAKERVATIVDVDSDEEDADAKEPLKGK